MAFTKAKRERVFIKLAITGTSGSGKTYSALRLARGLVGDKGRIAFADTENGSAKLYADLTDFDHCDIAPDRVTGKFDYKQFARAIKDAENAGYDCIIVDSASHLWQGILEEKSDKDAKGGNSYTNWAEPSKHLNDTIQSFLQAKIHVISCMRSKTDYVLETNDKGKQAPKKIGLAPVMRDGIEYEFTTVFDVGMNHHAGTSKDRTGLFVDKTFQITEQTGKDIAAWLNAASEPAPVAEEKAIEVNIVPPPEPKPSQGKKIPVTDPPKQSETKQSKVNPVSQAAPVESLPAVEPPKPDNLPKTDNRPGDILWIKSKVADGELIPAEIRQYNGGKKLDELNEDEFAKFIGNAILAMDIRQQCKKEGIPLRKLEEFAKEAKQPDFFCSSFETKHQIAAALGFDLPPF